MTQIKQHKTIHLGKMFLWIFVALFLFITCTGIFLYFFSERYVNENISKYVYEKSNHTYRVNFKNIHLNFFQREIEVTDLSFYPDTIIKANIQKKLYAFKTEELKIKKIDVLSLIRKKRFNAESFIIKSPELTLNSGENINLDQLSKNKISKGDTLKIPFFEVIFFDTILVMDAKLGIDTMFNTLNEAPKINLEANHFKIGGKKMTDSPFPFDVSDVSLKIENIRKNLPDSLHFITVQQISLSLMNSTITAKSVYLKPIVDTTGTANKYNIEMPEIKLQSSHLDQFTSDTFEIESMLIIDPVIGIKFGTDIKKGTPLNEINLYSLINGSYKWIQLQQVSIKNADVKLIPSDSDSVAQHFESLFINFNDFRADSNSYKDAERILSAKELEITLKKFTLNHYDQIHRLTIADLKVSTNNKIVKTGLVEFKPVYSTRNNLNTTISTTCESIILKEIDFFKMYHNQVVKMSDFKIIHPSTRISFERKSQKSKKIKSKSLVLEKTQDYIKGIYVDKTSISDGFLKYNYTDNEDNAGFFSTNYNIGLSQLSLDSITFYLSDKILFADNFDLKFNDINLQLADEEHRMTVNFFELSSKEQTAEIQDLKIIPIELDANDTLSTNQKNVIFDIHFPRIKLSGANLHQAFFYKKFDIYNFNIYNPVFNIEKTGNWSAEEHNEQAYQNEMYSLISDYMNKINIRNLTMTNGTLNLIQHKKNQADFELSNIFSIKMKNFEIDENSSKQDKKLFFSDDIDLILKNHTLTLVDGVHKLDAKEIGILTSEKKVYIKNANLYPDILSDLFKNIPLSVFAEIPYMEIADADILSFINRGIFPSNVITINNPKIKLLFQKTENENNIEKTNSTHSFLDDFKSISTNKLSIKNGKLELANYENFKSSGFIYSDIDIDIAGFKIVQQKNRFNTSYSDFHFNLNNVIYDLPDKIHSLRVANINYKLNRKVLDLKNIVISPLKSISLNEKYQFINIDIPKIQLTDFDVESFLETKNIISNELIIDKPVIKIKDNRIENKKTFSPYRMDLYPKIKTFANLISISSIELNDASVNFDNIKPIQLNNIYLTANDFIIDKQNSNIGHLLNSKSVNFQISNLDGKTKDGYFKYGIDKIILNDKGEFNVKGLSLKPIYNQIDFARKKRYQADYFTIENIDMAGNHLNVESFIKNRNISIAELSIDCHNVSIHRDKTFPLDPKQFPLMPQEAIRNIKQTIHIDKTYIVCDSFKYTELEPNATKSSYVYVTDGSIAVSNFTNDRNLLNKNAHMLANINGKLMGVSNAVINLDFDVYSFGNEFTFSATVDEMPLSKLNPITETGLNLSIKEGINQRMDVHFEANGDSAVGEMRFHYNDLKISVLSTKDGELKEGKFISFLVNAIAVKSDNPKPGRIMLPAKFINHRDKKRSIVGYCWKSIFAGIKSTLGIKEKEAKEAKEEPK